MGSPAKSGGVPWLDPHQLPFTLMIVVGVVGAVLSHVGYLMAWWNDLHVWGFVTSVVITGLGTVATWLLGATRVQVGRVADGVDAVHADVRTSNALLKDVADEQRRQGDEQRRQGGVLQGISDEQRRQGEEQRVQTGVLRDIRDRLPGPASQR